MTTPTEPCKSEEHYKERAHAIWNAGQCWTEMSMLIEELYELAASSQKTVEWPEKYILNAGLHGAQQFSLKEQLMWNNAIDVCIAAHNKAQSEPEHRPITFKDGSSICSTECQICFPKAQAAQKAEPPIFNLDGTRWYRPKEDVQNPGEDEVEWLATHLWSIIDESNDLWLNLSKSEKEHWRIRARILIRDGYRKSPVAVDWELPYIEALHKEFNGKINLENLILLTGWHIDFIKKKVLGGEYGNNL